MLYTYLNIFVNSPQGNEPPQRGFFSFVSSTRKKISHHQISKTRLNYHRERFRKLTFRALALRQSEGQRANAQNVSFLNFFTVVIQPLSTRLIKPNFCFDKDCSHLKEKRTCEPRKWFWKAPEFWIKQC